MKKAANKPNVSRKKFLFWGIGISALLTVPAIFRGRKKSVSTTKMLTEDGRLVEINIADIPSKKKKLQDSEIPGWVKNKGRL